MLFSYPISELFFFVLCISARLSVHNSVRNQGFGNSSFLVRNQIKTKQHIYFDGNSLLLLRLNYISILKIICAYLILLLGLIEVSTVNFAPKHLKRH